MRGHDEVIELLNEVLTGELTAINQYFLHAKMCDNWGYKRLAAHVRDESIDEMKHAESLTERLLYLEGIPNLQRLNDGIALCTRLGDNGTRELLEDILVEEEHHVDWLETQLETIRQIGLEHYLAQQLT